MRVEKLKCELKSRSCASAPYTPRVTGLHAETALQEYRAERRGGEILGEMAKNGQRAQRGGDQKAKSHDATLELADLGLSKSDSSRWQSVAAVPEDEFEAFLSEKKEDGKELTSAAAHFARLTARDRWGCARKGGRWRITAPNVIRGSPSNWQP